MAELPAKEGAARPPVGQIGFHLAVEGGGVVVVANVRQLMDHHVFNGGLGIGHQVEGEAETVFAGAAAEAGAGGGDSDAGGLHAHALGPVGHQGRQCLFCLLPPCVRLCRRRLRVGG